MYFVQTWIMKDYPAELMVTTIACIFVVIISTTGALIADPNSKAWVLKVYHADYSCIMFSKNCLRVKFSYANVFVVFF